MYSGEAILSAFLIVVAALCPATLEQAFSSEPGNFRIVHTGNEDEVRIAVKIPHFSNMSTLYPNLELPDVGKEVSSLPSTSTVAQDTTSATEVGYNETAESSAASNVGKRSARAYPMGVPYHRFRKRYYENPPSSWSGKWFNQLKRRTSMIMNPVPSAYDRRQQMMLTEEVGTADEPEMSATYQHGGGYGGHGGGHGKGGVNKSAVGLLGFLSLLSLIQNVLNQTQPMGRRRREVVTGGNDDYVSDEVGFNWEEDAADVNKIVPLILPVTNAVAAAQNGEVSVECTFRPICLANHFLVDKLGEPGKVVGEAISDIFSKILKRASWRWRSPELTTSGKIIRAGISGRAGKDCAGLYKECTELSKLQQHSPEVILQLLENQENY